MREAIDFLSSVDISQLATDPRVLVATAVVAVIAIIMRWKLVILVIFGVGALMAVARYANMKDAALDTNLYIFVGGAVAVGFVLIYFLFIRGD